ncbi:hypothetical protein TNCV_3496191 [Trichonephila clavipes]|nr:hypothetical protein TNCV_3496191 [Trichonephila clavipes]
MVPICACISVLEPSIIPPNEKSCTTITLQSNDVVLMVTGTRRSPYERPTWIRLQAKPGNRRKTSDMPPLTILSIDVVIKIMETPVNKSDIFECASSQSNWSQRDRSIPTLDLVRGTVSKVMTAYTQRGKKNSAKQSSAQNEKLSEKN